nr:hypothetical protein [Prevotella sp.]
MSKELEAARALVKMLEEREQSNKVKLESLKAGETFYIGENDYIVLEQHEGKTKVISKDFIAEDRKFADDTADYKTSGLRKYIEAKIQPTIENKVGAENLVEHRVSLETVDGQDNYGELTCKVRPITFDEARQYNNLIVNKDLDDWWWTCTAWTSPSRECNRSIAVVLPAGDIDNSNCYRSRGVRPVCIFSSSIFAEEIKQ